jgi:hypothetical protein
MDDCDGQLVGVRELPQREDASAELTVRQINVVAGSSR